MTINRAYILSLTTSNSAVVVLSVAHAGSDSPTIYRGRSVGVNWWGTLREYEADIKQALKEALKPLKAELQQVCSTPLQS
ncbi:hypothetical protein SAMN05660479_01040 [Microbulbifer thermotolerans]|nr:hypothetical protein SAMN05660479_01040 [Microbulbifer thermotolerans]